MSSLDDYEHFDMPVLPWPVQVMLDLSIRLLVLLRDLWLRGEVL